MTGISRKEIMRIRTEYDEDRWTPAMEVSPANLLLHYWHFDNDFAKSPGDPLDLPSEGEISFSALAHRYAGDIPVGALREELKRAGVISEINGLLSVQKRYFQPNEFHEDFIRNIAFSIRNVACTVVHNAGLVSRPDFNPTMNELNGRFERFAWSERLSIDSRENFRQWVRKEGANFVENADHWIGEHELTNESLNTDIEKSIGVGVYFFEED